MFCWSTRWILASTHFINPAEDDCVLGTACPEPSRMQNVLEKAWQNLTKQFPEWSCLLLGGTPRYAFGFRNLSTKTPGIFFADYVLQGHALLWRATTSCNTYLEQAQQRIDDGALNDNAIASVMRSYPQRFFLPRATIGGPKLFHDIKSAVAGQSWRSTRIPASVQQASADQQSKSWKARASQFTAKCAKCTWLQTSRRGEDWKKCLARTASKLCKQRWPMFWTWL